MLTPVAEPKRKATYEDVLAAPENKVAEIVDGELILSPRPGFRHATAASRLGFVVGGAFDGAGGDPARPGGWMILFEPELHFADDVVVPDIAGWRREHAPTRPDAAWIEIAPSWLCETLSPSTARIDRGRKLAIYARTGVQCVWLLDPLARTLEVLRLGDEGRYVIAAVHTGDERARAEPFEAVEVELGRLWLE
jgi:Uma2 family endonuclease